MFDIAKNATNASSSVNLNFDIDASHLATNEKLKTALRDISENVYQKSSAMEIKGDIMATVMPLQFGKEYYNI